SDWAFPQSDGTIVAVGTAGSDDSRFLLTFARAMADAALDPAFATAASVSTPLATSYLDVAGAPDGGYIVSGSDGKTRFALRLDDRGAKDRGFAGGAGIVQYTASVRAISSIGDGGILITPANVGRRNLSSTLVGDDGFATTGIEFETSCQLAAGSNVCD